MKRQEKVKVILKKGNCNINVARSGIPSLFPYSARI